MSKTILIEMKEITKSLERIAVIGQREGRISAFDEILSLLSEWGEEEIKKKEGLIQTLEKRRKNC